MKDDSNDVPIDQVVRNLMDSLPDAKANQSLDTAMLYGELEAAKSSFMQLQLIKDEIMKKAKFRAKLSMGVGLGALVGYFNFVAIGTYYVWSWDVVEPLAYFLGLSGTIFATSRYFKLQQDYENDTYFEYLSNKHFHRIAPKYGFSEEDYDSAREEVNSLRNRLKLSMLIDL